MNLTTISSRMRLHGNFLLQWPQISSVTFLQKYSWQLFLTTKRNTHRGPLQQTSTMWVMKYTPLDKITKVLPSFHFEGEMWHECGQRLTRKPNRQPGFSEQRIWQVPCERREWKWWETWIKNTTNTSRHSSTQNTLLLQKWHYYDVYSHKCEYCNNTRSDKKLWRQNQINLKKKKCRFKQFSYKLQFK